MISIITPVYKGERFIESCIKTVIEQNCSNVEHIIMDGGSTDRTVEIIKQYAEQYSHIRWISEKDKGQSDAMNKGIAIAQGEILGILNVDDFYEPNVLNRILEIFTNLPEPSFLVGNCKILGEEDRITTINKPQQLNLLDIVSMKSPFPVNPSSYFYHKSLHQKIGLYEVGEHYVMDVDFILKAIQAANVKYVDETWGNYRMIPGTKTVSSLENGRGIRYIKKIFNKHAKTLPLSQYLQAIFAMMVWSRIKYFSEKPQEILPRLTLRLKNMLFTKTANS
jgi:glycosyltransferase involved in cell wall biosynthesis